MRRQVMRGVDASRTSGRPRTARARRRPLLLLAAWRRYAPQGVDEEQGQATAREGIPMEFAKVASTAFVLIDADWSAARVLGLVEQADGVETAPRIMPLS